MKITRFANKREYMIEQAGWPVDVVDGSIVLSRELSGNNSDKYAFWIAREIMKTIQTTSIRSFDEFMKDLDARKSLGYIIGWVNQLEKNVIWTRDMDEQQESGYTTNEIVSFLRDGWRVVEVTLDDLDNELEQLGYAGGYDYYKELMLSLRNRFFSLRDANNKPHFLLETSYFLLPQEVVGEEQFGYGNDMNFGSHDYEMLEDEVKEKMVEFFRSLSQQGVDISVDYEDAFDYDDMIELISEYNKNGIKVNFGINNYEEHIDAIVGITANNGREGLIVSNAMEDFEGLVANALQHDELDKLENAIEAFEEGMGDKFQEWFWDNAEPEMEHKFPHEKDYTYEYIPDYVQPEFSGSGFEEAQNVKFDEDAYNKARQLYEEERNNLEKYYYENDSMFQFANEMRKSIQLERKKLVQQEKELMDMTMQEMTASSLTTLYHDEGGTSTEGANKNITMIRTAKTKVPPHDEIAAYVESLKLHAKRGVVDSRVKSVITSMPSVKKIKSELSDEESKILFESVRWAWKEITGSDIITTLNHSSSPETLEGNYWMLNNGVLLHGANHFTIVRNNLDLFARLLNIDPFVLHQKLASYPEQMIRLIISHGGMRIFATRDKRIYFQLSPETYSRWGGSKIRKLDFSKKTVRLVGKRAPYSGWKSGVTILLS